MIDPTALDNLLEVLREHNVASFSCPEFSVDLLPAVVARKGADPDIARAVAQREAARVLPPAKGNYGHPSLWPNGKPPAFTRKEEVRVSPFQGESNDED